MSADAATGASPRQRLHRRLGLVLLLLLVPLGPRLAREAGAGNELLAPALGALALALLAVGLRRRLHREPETLVVFALLLIVVEAVVWSGSTEALPAAREAEALAGQALARAEHDPSRAALHGEDADQWLATATSARWSFASSIVSGLFLALLATACVREVWLSLGGRPRRAAPG